MGRPMEIADQQGELSKPLPSLIGYGLEWCGRVKLQVQRYRRSRRRCLQIANATWALTDCPWLRRDRVSSRPKVPLHGEMRSPPSQGAANDGREPAGW